jgi:ribosome biogenesis GTPase A
MTFYSVHLHKKNKAIFNFQDKEALILLVVDLLDFPGSVWPNILELLGKKKRIILVGNKLDLLMPDHGRYIKHINSVMQQEFLRKCYESASPSGGGNTDQPDGRGRADQSEVGGGKVFPHVISSVCLSARTGLNLELLVEKIFHFWKWNNNSLPGDIYIVGINAL